MKYQDQDKNDLMAMFHNEVVALIDVSPLSPPEIIAVLRICVTEAERLFEIAVKNPVVKKDE